MFPPQGQVADKIAPGAAGSGLTETNGVLAVNVQSGLQINAGDDAVQVQADGINSAMVADSVIGTGRLADAGVSPRKTQSNGAYTFGNVSAGGLSAGGILARGATDLSDNPLHGVRVSPSAVSAADISVGEIIIDAAQDKLAWKQATGSAWAVSGISIS